MRILLTGANGWTAKAIVEELIAAGHTVIGLDLPDVKGHTSPKNFEKLYSGSVSDYDFMLTAMQNIDVVVHLAVAVNGGYDTPQIPFDVNVRGTANVFQAARQQGVKRVILMSSAPFHVEHSGKIHAVDDRLQGTGGDFMYDMTKCLQEDIASYYANTFNLSVITLRAGHIVDGKANLDPKGRSLDNIQYGRGSWICRYDLARAVDHALSYDMTGYDAFHIIGADAARTRFDMQRTEEIFEFFPETRFEAYL